MKATGIVRRIDDLGRVVIPKEIRKTLRIKEGTPLEIFTDREGEIILKKYSPIGEFHSYSHPTVAKQQLKIETLQNKLLFLYYKIKTTEAFQIRQPDIPFFSSGHSFPGTT